jgi:hypothetical protein
MRTLITFKCTAYEFGLFQPGLARLRQARNVNATTRSKFGAWHACRFNTATLTSTVGHRDTVRYRDLFKVVDSVYVLYRICGL